MALLESVPNVSEGRDPAVIEAIRPGVRRRRARARRPFRCRSSPLGLHARRGRRRSRRAAAGRDRPGGGADRPARARRDPSADRSRRRRADRAARGPARWRSRSRWRSSSGGASGDELGLPVFVYGSGEVGAGRRPAFFRRGGPAELQRRLDAGELQPDFGPARLDPRAGGVLVGARPLLVAFNIELATGDARRRAGDRRRDPGVERRAWRACRRSACPAARAGARR